MSTRLLLNGESADSAARTVQDLLLAQGLDPAARGLAVALNGSVVPRREWPCQALAEGDRVEIVRPFAGG